MPMPVVNLKALLRREALAHRLALRPEELAKRSEQLCQQLFAHFSVADWRWLHVFLPLARRHEPDTWPIIQRVWVEAPATRLAVPVVQADGVALLSYELSQATVFKPNRWGIPEPDDLTATPVAAPAFEAVLVPLLVCDASGQRVGYGGGFYDRFLAQCQPGTAFIGLNMLDEPPIAAIADVLPTDVPLTACITPSRVWWF